MNNEMAMCIIRLALLLMLLHVYQIFKSETLYLYVEFEVKDMALAENAAQKAVQDSIMHNVVERNYEKAKEDSIIKTIRESVKGIHPTA